MKRILIIITVLGLSSTTLAENLKEIRKRYDALSPVTAQRISSDQVIEPEASNLTPLEEQVAELRSKEEEQKKADTEKVYLDTDFHFFQALAVPNEDDELDRSFKKDELDEILEKNAQTTKTLSGEIKTTTPKTFTRQQGEAMDKRRALILKKIASNGHFVRTCIRQNQRPGIPFKGTTLTLSWEVVPSGKVENAQIKSTDIPAREITNCVLKGMGEWNFADIMKEGGKRSQIEYTFRFANPSVQAQN